MFGHFLYSVDCFASFAIRKPVKLYLDSRLLYVHLFVRWLDILQNMWMKDLNYGIYSTAVMGHYLTLSTGSSSLGGPWHSCLERWLVFDGRHSAC